MSVRCPCYHVCDPLPPNDAEDEGIQDEDAEHLVPLWEPKQGVDDIHATPRTYYRSGMRPPLILHPLPLFFRGRFGFVISGSAPDSSKLH